MNYEILVIGSLNMDLVVGTPRLPVKGETVLGSTFNTYPGGKGANQAVAAALAGGRVGMLGRIGTDDFGSYLLDTLQTAEVGIELIIPTQGIPTGTALITVDRAGDNTIVVVPGANGMVIPEDIQAAQDAILTAQVVILQMEIPFESVIQAIEIATQVGAQVILNAAPAQPLPEGLLYGLDYLVVNETELQVIAQAEPADDFASHCQYLLQKGVKNLIVTLGALGVAVYTPERSFQLPAMEVEVVDTTAAGDAFVGALAAGIVQGLPLREAVVIANAAGALAVSKAGAQPSLPSKTEINRFLGEEKV